MHLKQSKKGKRSKQTAEKTGVEDKDTLISASRESVRSLNNDNGRPGSSILPPQTGTSPPSHPAPRPMFPGAVRVRGPDWQEEGDGSRRTIMIGSDGESILLNRDATEFHSLTTDAYVPTDDASSEGLIIPIQVSLIDDDDDPVKRSYYVRKMVCILLATLIGSGLVVGIVFGVRKREDSSTLEAPTLLTKKWVKAGEISVSNGAPLSMSPSGNRVAVMNSLVELGDTLGETELVTVLVYQQDDDNGSWSLLGDTIGGGTLVSSLSLLGNRLAIASLDIGVIVYELQDDNTWKRLGNEIEIAEADSVLLAQDGNLLAIGARYEVSLYSITNEHGWTLMSSIPTRTVKNEMAISSDGTTLLVDLIVHQFHQHATNSYISTGPFLPSPHVPVSMSRDGKVIAIGEPQSMNGKVSIFRNYGHEWKLEAQLNGTVSNEKFGSSLALSGNGNQIVVLNDGGGETRATVYTTLRESTWIPAIEDLTLALKNAKVFISQDGGRVAIGGDGSVVVYDIVE